MTPLSRKTKFPYRLWRFTGPEENLFHLTPEELAMFALFCQEASK